ncbi:MAG: hypothetical protein HQM00_07660 [Magnetococcales bacterium]|nr:hypothetical protein [Magnetococcales bacterium]
MLNPLELQNRKFATAMDGHHLLINRTHTVTEGTTQYIYMGYAYPGSGENDPVWMIKRVAIAADGSSSTLFAGGEARFNQIWSDYTSLSYA